MADAPVLTRILKRGSKDTPTLNDVSTLQTKLGNLEVDGIFGRKTEAAVRAFQTTAGGLVVDGKYGPMTHAKLWGIEPIHHDYIQPTNMKQYDATADKGCPNYKWGSRQYSSTNNPKQTMKSSGCGPSAASNALKTLLEDNSIDPYELAKKALAWGDRTANDGTAWAFFPHLKRDYPVEVVKSTSLESLKACLDAGGYAVCSMGPGYWTSGGHYICVWKYDDTYIYANDPASSTRKQQKITDFMKQRKAFFLITKKG